MAEPQDCRGCFKQTVPEVVQIRQPDRTWISSGITRCPECKITSGGTIEERLAHVARIYDYKYFGDYALSPEQMDAVGEMLEIAGLVPNLVRLIEQLSGALVDEGPDWSDAGIYSLRCRIADALPDNHCPDWLLPYRGKAEGRQP